MGADAERLYGGGIWLASSPTRHGKARSALPERRRMEWPSDRVRRLAAGISPTTGLLVIRLSMVERLVDRRRPDYREDRSQGIGRTAHLHRAFVQPRRC